MDKGGGGKTLIHKMWIKKTCFLLNLFLTVKTIIKEGADVQ